MVTDAGQVVATLLMIFVLTILVILPGGVFAHGLCKKRWQSLRRNWYFLILFYGEDSGIATAAR